MNFDQIISHAPLLISLFVLTLSDAYMRLVWEEEWKTTIPGILSHYVVLLGMAVINWRYGLAAWVLYLVIEEVAKFVAITQFKEELMDAFDDFGASICLVVFILVLIFLPFAWALPMAGVLIGVPLLVALMFASVSFRAGVLATIGVLTVLGICHGVLHLVH